MRKHLSATAAAMSALLLSLSFVTGCNTGTSADAKVIAETPSLLTPLEIPVNSMSVGYNDILISSYYEATVVPYVEEYVFTIGGNVANLYYDLGDTVEKGALLAELDHAKIDSQISSLENKINSAKQKTERENSNYYVQIENLKLKKSRIQSGEIASSNPKGEMAVIDCDIAIYEKKISQNLDNLAKDIADPEEQLVSLKENYNAYFLYAPMSGTVVYAATDRSIDANVTIMAIADLNTKYIQAVASAENNIYNAYDVYALHNGKPYEIMHVPTIYDTTCENLVSAKGRFSNFIVNGSMDDFTFGDYVLICVDTTYVEHALSIPNTSLNTDSSGTYVYLVSEDGVRTRQNISIGITDSIHTVVIDGLKEGDVIYVPN